MRRFWTAATMAALLCGCGGVNATRTQPNILLVVIDTVRADHVGCYGYERNTTPNLDAFARESVLYANAFATCSWTKPSTTSLLTGRDCRGHGVQAAFDKLPEGVPYLPEELQARGYQTAVFSGNMFICRQDGFARGCDRFWQWGPDETWVSYVGREVEIDDAVVANQAIPWMRSASSPWFCYVHLMGGHAPYHLPARADDFGPDSIDQYDAKLRYVDRQLGRLLAEAPPDTIVIITSDHGEEFGEHGGSMHGRTLYDEVLRVPLLIRWPGIAGYREHGLVGLDRIAPALLATELPETGGRVKCHLEIRGEADALVDVLTRTITESDLPETGPLDIDADALRREQLEALGYF